MIVLTVVVQTQGGKEFPDMRQNEREIKFMRVGDAVRTVGSSGRAGNEQESLVHFYTQEWDRRLAGHLLIG